MGVQISHRSCYPELSLLLVGVLHFGEKFEEEASFWVLDLAALNGGDLVCDCSNLEISKLPQPVNRAVVLLD